MSKMRIKVIFDRKDTALDLYTPQDLEILIATMNRSDLSFLEAMFQTDVENIPYKILIVNQSKDKVLVSDYSTIRVINDTEYGLSRSRNMAIENCCATFGWVMDDDTVIPNYSVESILEKLNEVNCINVFRSVNFNGELRKQYPMETKCLKSKKSLLRLSSIEMVINVKLLKSLSVRFDERFGLGAQFPMGEEYVLATDVLSKKGKIIFYPLTIVIHKDLSTGQNPKSTEAIYTRGALTARDNVFFTSILNLKHIFSLWRKGYVTKWDELKEKYRVFNNGVNDYNNLRFKNMK